MPTDPPPVPDLHDLTTDRLRLTASGPSAQAFAERLFALPELTRHRPDPGPDDAETVARRLAAEAAHWQRHGVGRWLLADRADGTPIGFGGLTVPLLPDTPGFNLSFHLAPEAWGKGYATEFGHRALDIAFGPLGAPQVVALVRTANPASRAVLLRLGFHPSGEVQLRGAPTCLYRKLPPG